MTAAARVDLCKAVAKDRGWAISAAEFEGWKTCGKAMVAEYHDPSTEVFSVREEAKKGGVARKGEGITSDLSSTSIRAELESRGRTVETVDDLIRRGLLGEAVGACLKEYFTASSSARDGSKDPDEVKGGGQPEGKGAKSFKGYAGQVDAVARSTVPSAPSLTEAKFREIRAIYDEQTITVYQAYNAGIADAAVAANSFRAPMEILGFLLAGSEDLNLLGVFKNYNESAKVRT